MNKDFNNIINPQSIPEGILTFFQRWFNDYTDRYIYDKKRQIIDFYEMKRVHTHEVCRYITAVTKKYTNDDGKINLAEVIGLFHDLGRFEQFKTYNTFEDSKSVNHGYLSCRELVKSGILLKLNPIAKNTVLCAIAQHTKKHITHNLKPEYVFWSKLLRDADKISLFPFFIENIPEWERNNELVGDGKISDKYLKAASQGNALERESYRNLNEFKIFILTWIYDINFAESKEILKEQNIISLFFKMLPDTDNIKCFRSKLLAHIE